MHDNERRPEISAAMAYEDFFVKGLFEAWTSKVLDAAMVSNGQRLLDVACGTGVLARKAAARVGPTGRVTGVDPSPGMLAVAERIAPTVQWRPCAAESMPFADSSFDGVVSQFGLMYFRDRPQAISEMLRVLKANGRLAVAVWNSLESMPVYASEVALLERIVGKQAADALRAPFELGDQKQLSGLFEKAGAASVVVTTHYGTAKFPDIRTMVEAELRGWLPVLDVVLTDEMMRQVLEAAETDLDPYCTDEGHVLFETSGHIVVSTKC